MMRLVLIPLLLGCLAVIGTADERDRIVSRYRDFAVSHLNDKDPEVASASLDALATLDFNLYSTLVRDSLRNPLTHPAVLYALDNLVGRTTPRDLKNVREILEAAHIQGERDRRDDPFAADMAGVEMSAIEVLLASGDQVSRRFATRYLENVIGTFKPGDPIGRTMDAVALVGKYKVKSAAEMIDERVVSALDDAALSALAKNGDKTAIASLKKRFEASNDIAVLLMNDNQLIDILSLEPGELRHIFQNSGGVLRVLAAAQLARMGHKSELHAVIKNCLEDPDGEASFALLDVIGDSGDESFIPDLDRIATVDKSAFGKLLVAKAIFQIASRNKK